MSVFITTPRKAFEICMEVQMRHEITVFERGIHFSPRPL